MLRDVERSSNPWGKPQAERAAWADGLDVRVLQPGDPPPEILYWVGCAASFDERARAVRPRHDASLLLAAGARRRDPRPARVAAPATRRGGWATSTPSRRTPGQNVATLDEAGVTKIVASCPHCFNTLGERVPATSAARTRSSTTRSCSPSSSRDGRLEPVAGDGGRSRTTTPATWRATTT